MPSNVSSVPSNLESLFTKIQNKANKNLLIYNDNKILFNNELYERQESEWSLVEDIVDDDEKLEYLGFVTIKKHEEDLEKFSEKVKKMKIVSQRVPQSQKEILQTQKVKRFYDKCKSSDFLNKNIDDFEKAENDVQKEFLKFDFNGRELDDNCCKMIKMVYDNALVGDHYTKYKHYRMFVLISDQLNMVKQNNNDYTVFHNVLKNVTGFETKKISKFERKINIFREFFNLLPIGSWSCCDIPITYWNLIRNKVWKKLIKCLAQNNEFIYESNSESNDED